MAVLKILIVIVLLANIIVLVVVVTNLLKLEERATKKIASLEQDAQELVGSIMGMFGGGG